MKKIVLPLIIISAASFVHADHDRGFFAGGAFSYISNEDVPDDAKRDDINIGAIEIVGGYKYNPWLGVDIRYGAGLSDRSVGLVTNIDDTAGFEYDIEGYQSVYYRPELTNSEAKIYALIGYTQLDYAVTAIDSDGNSLNSASSSESGSSYGLGVGWFANEQININLEYKALLDEDEAEFDSVTLGVDYRF